MYFVGVYELTIDSKNRLSIPHPVRSKINADSDGRAFYVVPGRRRGILAVYPEHYYERLRRFVPPEEQLSESTQAWRQFELSQSVLLDPDNQGRILIPERLLKWGKIQKQVTLIGVQDHLEIWNREEYGRFEQEHWDDYSERRARAMKELRAFTATVPGEGATQGC
jgi:MraZ protein